jgi:hypothetical protein
LKCFAESIASAFKNYSWNPESSLVLVRWLGSDFGSHTGYRSLTAAAQFLTDEKEEGGLR